jgi:hypothetical protein
VRHITYLCLNGLVLLSVLSACGAPSEQAEPATSKTEKASASPKLVATNSQHQPSVYVATLNKDVGVPEALQSGALKIRDGCLVVDSGGQVSLAILPKGSSLGKTGAVYLGGHRVGLNSEVRFGGGSYPAGHEIFRSLPHPIALGCPKNGMLIGELL